MILKLILIIVLLILLLILAIIIAQPASRTTIGGAPPRYDHVTVKVTPQGVHHKHPLGVALHNYARTLSVKDVIGTHMLESDHYDATVQGGGAALPWNKYKTWKSLQADKRALEAYFKVRATVLNNPDLDWSPVLTKVLPLLDENREFIGIADLAADGHTLQLTAIEASPLEAGTEDGITFASIPSELVEKYASRPGLFLFHTHPADPRGNPLPSSHDLAAAIYFGATSRFAACAVISRYGVIVHGLDWSAYKAINVASDWQLATLNFSHDVVAAHEAIRSWASYDIPEYLNFYSRHRLLLFIYPSSEMIGDTRRFVYLWDLETPIDHELITEFSSEITEHYMKKSSHARKAALLSTKSIGVPMEFD